MMAETQDLHPAIVSVPALWPRPPGASPGVAAVRTRTGLAVAAWTGHGLSGRVDGIGVVVRALVRNRGTVSAAGGRRLAGRALAGGRSVLRAGDRELGRGGKLDGTRGPALAARRSGAGLPTGPKLPHEPIERTQVLLVHVVQREPGHGRASLDLFRGLDPLVLGHLRGRSGGWTGTSCPSRPFQPSASPEPVLLGLCRRSAANPRCGQSLQPPIWAMPSGRRRGSCRRRCSAAGKRSPSRGVGEHRGRRMPSGGRDLRWVE